MAGICPPSLTDERRYGALGWQGKRLLLILDNAASSDQVTPLLPGAAGRLVLVTSRRYLGDPPATLEPVPLDTFQHGEPHCRGRPQPRGRGRLCR